jgi:hypothetical protein
MTKEKQRRCYWLQALRPQVARGFASAIDGCNRG